MHFLENMMMFASHFFHHMIERANTIEAVIVSHQGGQNAQSDDSDL